MLFPDILFLLYSLLFQPGEKVPVLPMIREASGIADSRSHPGCLWVHEDSGHPPQLYLLGHDGRVVKKMYLKGAKNRDWEDIVLAGNFLYIGDIGDNRRKFKEYRIYRMEEPAATVDTVIRYQTIRFRYPDGGHNAEAFLADPLTGDLFIITKTDRPSRVYKLTYPYSLDSINIATFAGRLPYKGVVSAALSPDSREILVKTYFELRSYCRQPGESIDQALQKKYTAVPYVPEMQGEAVTFSLAGDGFFTLSEKALARKVKLRKSQAPGIPR